MPIYCYKCFDCNHYEEIKQSMDAEPLTVCPVCGGDFKRVIRNVGVIFKGSGFHVTDYGRKAKTALKSDKEKKEEKKTEEKAGKKTESKSETKSGEKSKSGKNEVAA